MAKKIYPLNISRQIDTNFRNYALYVLENRGIPSFYDGLTNVQRFILLNAPSTFNKTISLVGSCISDGYHHGDKSLTGAVNKLARPFGCSEQLLLGDGFFGTPVNQEASAARYTSVKINPTINEMIKKSEFLNSRNEEGNWDSLWVDLPIGLTNTIVGIAVGYKTTVLPRDLKDIQKFLEGKTKQIIPKFKGFSGKITRFKGMDKTWLIEGVTERKDFERVIRVTELPPLMRYTAFLKKLDSINTYFGGMMKLTNNSSTNVDIHIKFTGAAADWEAFASMVEKSTKMLVTETPVFVKDGVVLEYDKIEDYVEDFKYRLAELRVKRTEYFLNVNSEELVFQRCKEKYLLFMLANKGEIYPEAEIEKFLKEVTNLLQADMASSVKRRLNAILLRSLSEEELERTRKAIKDLEIEVEKQKAELSEAVKVFESMEDTSIKRGTQNKSTKNVNLMEDIEDEIDGISLYQEEEEELYENE
jgi:hypothetical protein